MNYIDSDNIVNLAIFCIVTNNIHNFNLLKKNFNVLSTLDFIKIKQAANKVKFELDENLILSYIKKISDKDLYEVFLSGEFDRDKIFVLLLENNSYYAKEIAINHYDKLCKEFRNKIETILIFG